MIQIPSIVTRVLDGANLPSLIKIRRLIRTAYEVKEVYGTAKGVYAYGKSKLSRKKVFSLALNEDHFCYDVMWTYIKDEAMKRNLDDVRQIRAIANANTKADSVATYQVDLVADPQIPHSFYVEGFEINVQFGTGDPYAAPAGEGNIVKGITKETSISQLHQAIQNASKYNQKYILFSMTSRAAIDALERLMSHLYESQFVWQGKIRYSRYAGFGSSSKLIERPLKTVILKDGLMEGLINDVEKFLDEEQKYIERGIPYHRGYLFYGPPGTGKSSTAKALATHFKMNLHVISLNGIPDDSTLLDLLAQSGERTLVLFEDIDIFSAAKHRETEESRGKDMGFSSLTLAGMLNALDGVATPHGLIVIMTTNRKEDLDEALVRKGRVDYEVHVDNPDEEQIHRMWELFYPGLTPEFTVVGNPLPTSTYYDVFKRNLETPDEARVELIEIIEKAAEKKEVEPLRLVVNEDETPQQKVDRGNKALKSISFDSLDDEYDPAWDYDTSDPSSPYQANGVTKVRPVDRGGRNPSARKRAAKDS